MPDWVRLKNLQQKVVDSQYWPFALCQWPDCTAISSCSTLLCSCSRWISQDASAFLSNRTLRVQHISSKRYSSAWTPLLAGQRIKQARKLLPRKQPSSGKKWSYRTPHILFARMHLLAVSHHKGLHTWRELKACRGSRDSSAWIWRTWCSTHRLQRIWKLHSPILKCLKCSA